MKTARSEISAVACYTGSFSTRTLYDLCAEDVGTRLGLSIVMTRRCVASVAAAYREQRRVQQRFHPLTSIPYDRHTLQIDAQHQAVTLWTLIGWQSITFLTDAAFLHGWSLPTLIQLRGTWALLLVVPRLNSEQLREA